MAKVFIKLNLGNVYSLVRICERWKWKLAFHTRYGHYVYLVMPFSLFHSPVTLQYLMKDMFKDILCQFVVIYVDHIFIFTKYQTMYHRHV